MPFTGVVALDGPSGTGKSTVAAAVARRLSARYLDTGAMYRAATLAVLRAGTDPLDAVAVAETVAAAAITIGTDPEKPWIRLDEELVSEPIRGPEVTAAVSAVSAVPAVRAQLVSQQRDIIGDGGIVVEGRDIGTVVAPDAIAKVYLTARPEIRARRRADQDRQDVATVAADIDRRDKLDSGRSVSPSRPADDAVEVDSSDLTIEQVVTAIEDVVAKADAGQ